MLVSPASWDRRKTGHLPLAVLFILSLALGSRAQPTPAPFSGDLPCHPQGEAVDGLDTVAAAGPDAEGYFPLFDGTFKGWFHSCATAHSGGGDSGAIFRIGRHEGRPALYTAQRTLSGGGGALMTRRKFAHYELAFQFWTGYGNEAGILHRTTVNGRCFRTSLTTAGGGTMGGSWGEGGFPARDFRPFGIGGDMKTIHIPGNFNGELSNWTAITRKLKAGSEPDLPCPETGCTQEDWQALWNFDGWTDIKVQFYGSSRPEEGPVHMKIWFKKPTARVWVPLSQDTTLNHVVPPNHIGILVYGTGRFSWPLGTWYRDIRWKELDASGKPVRPGPSRISHPSHRASGHRFATGSGWLTGAMPEDYEMEVLDLNGRTLERFSGRAGAVRHAFASRGRGVQLLRIRTAGALETSRIVR